MALVVTAVLAATPAYAQDRTGEIGRTREIDRIFSWATPVTPGGVVAVSRHGKGVVSRAYGLADLERDVQVRPDTVFDAGSLVKQFVAAAVLLLVEEDRLSLSEDVRKYLPELPDYGHRITIDHLLTHTSGLRDWTALLPLAGQKPDVLTLILRQRGLNFAPGEEWAYSNSGYELLKEIVARTSGMSFAEFARKRLFEPLGMKATTYRRDLREVVKHRALAYEKEDGRWKMAMRLDNDRGGGALLTTAGDLLLWNDALADSRLGPFVTGKLHEPARLSSGRQLRYARGLIVEPYRGGRVVWHSGGAAGYHSWLGRLPEHGLSIAVLCNSDAVAASALARRVADRFLPAAGAGTAEAGVPAAADGGAGVTGLDLDGRAGLFFSERTGEPLRLVMNDGTLRIDGGPALVAVTRDRFRNPRGDLFFMSQDELELRFLSPDRLELKSMEGRTTRYRRARPYAPTAADLKAFAGRYESTEVGTVIQVEPKGDGLAVRLEHTPSRSLELQPVHRDTFQLSRVMVRFQRDRAGKVVALDYSNPVLRRIRLTRLRDRSRLPAFRAAAAVPDAGGRSLPVASPSGRVLLANSKRRAPRTWSAAPGGGIPPRTRHQAAGIRPRYGISPLQRAGVACTPYTVLH